MLSRNSVALFRAQFHSETNLANNYEKKLREKTDIWDQESLWKYQEKFSNVTPDHYIHLLRPKNQVVILLQYCCHCQMWRPREVSIPATMYPFLFNNATIIVCHIYIYYHYYFFQVSVIHNHSNQEESILAEF